MRKSLVAVASLALVSYVSLCCAPSLRSEASAKKEKKHEAEKASGTGAVKASLVPLSVVCATQGASVFVDAEMVGLTPMDMPVPVAAGDHTIKVTKLGYAPYIDVFATKGKKSVQLELELVPVSGVLHVKSSVPGARVLVDGRYVGDAPMDVETDVGARAVQVSKGGYKDFFQNVMSVAGQDLPIEANLDELPAEINPYKVKPAPPPKWYQKKWVWGVVGAGALLLAGGAVTAGVLGGPKDPIGGCQDCHDLRNWTPPSSSMQGLSSW